MEKDKISKLKADIRDLSETIESAQKALDVLRSDHTKAINDKVKVDSNSKVSQLEAEISQLENAAVDFDKKDESCTSKTCPFLWT